MSENTLEPAHTAPSFFTRIKNVSLDRVAALIMLCGALVFPVFFFPALGASIDIGKTVFFMAVVLLSFLFWILARLKDGSINIPLHPLFAAAGGIILVTTISALFSPAVRVSLYGFAYEVGTVVSLVILFLAMFLAAYFFENQKNVVRFYQGLLVVFGIVFLFQVMRLVAGADFLSWGGFLAGKTGNLIGKWNDMGLFAGLIALFSFITLEKINPSKWMRGVLYAALCASIFMLIVVNFYLVWVLIALFSLTIFVYNFSLFHFAKDKNHDIRRTDIFLSPSFFVMVISFIFVIGSSTIGGFVNETFRIVQIEARPSWSSTGIVLKETIKDSPLLGSGPNRFSNQWLEFKPEIINLSSFWNSEFRAGIGLVPTFAVTSGVLGAVVWALFLLLFFFYGLRFLFFSSPVQNEYALFSSFVLAAYLWIVSFFYVPNITLFALAFLLTGIFIGVAVKEGKIKKHSFSCFEHPRTGFVSVLLLTVLVVSTIMSVYSLARQAFALAHFHSARIAFSIAGDVERAEELINKSITQNKSDVYYRGLAEIKTNQIARLLARQNVSPESARAEFQSLLGAGINAGQSATQFDETNYANWVALFRVYGSVVPFVTGAYDNALISITEAQNRNPRNPLIILERARLELSNRNNNEARRYIGEALQMKPDYANAIFLLAQLEFAEGNIPQAIQSVEQAGMLAPNDAGLFLQLGLLKFNKADYEGAQSAFERAVSINPQFSNAKYFLGLSYYNTGRIEDARTQFEDLEKTNPGNEEVQRVLGVINSQKGKSSGSGKLLSPGESTQPPFEE